MKAYAVFDGGGVKGAALAGCLEAAQDDIEFVGFGGTSAGSIIATLAAAGYRGSEIRDVMLTGGGAHPRDLLEDSGALLFRALDAREHAMTITSSQSWMTTKLWKLKKLARSNGDVIARLLQSHGLYEGDRLRSVLLDLIKSKLPALANQRDVTFEDLHRARSAFLQTENREASALKIVASDLGGRAAVYSREDGEYGGSVLDAVRASAGYPFLFEPLTRAGTRLVDGGLASNLPSFLFGAEHSHTRFPILAFDLVAGDGAGTTSEFLGYLGKLMSTALEASDELFVRSNPGVFRVPIPVPEGISTLKFDLSDSDVNRLFSAGVEHATTYLKNLSQLQIAKSAGANIPQQLQAIYGSPLLIEPPLMAITEMVENRTEAKNVRASVMLPTGRPSRSRIVTYTFGYRPDDPDQDLELDEFGGCTGHALKNRSPAIADLDDARTNFASWGMNQLQQSKVPPDRNAMISVPIFSQSRSMKRSRQEMPILGVVSVDSSTKLEESGWLENGATTARVPSDIMLQILGPWADVIAGLLRSS